MKTNITVKSSDSGHQAAYSQTSALLLNNYVTVGRFLTFSSYISKTATKIELPDRVKC